MSVGGQSPPELEPEDLGDAVSDGDLATAFRVAASMEREARATIWSARVLSAVLHLLDAAGDGERAVADDVDRSELLPGGGETCLQLARIGAVEIE